MVGGNCITCGGKNGNDQSKKNDYEDYIETVDVETLYLNLKEEGKIANDSPTFICGDLNKFGWEVYTGANITKDLMAKVKIELMDIIYNNKNDWRDIEKGRKSYKTSGYIDGKSVMNAKNNKTRHINSIFKLIVDSCINRIDGFENATMLSPNVLINDGRVNQQKIHRDYECVHIDSL